MEHAHDMYVVMNEHTLLPFSEATFATVYTRR
jgi:hypothetical protein